MEFEKGFFKKFYRNTRNSLSAAEFDEFSKLKSDLTRFQFVARLKEADKLNVYLQHSKSFEAHKELKELGNQSFQNGDHKTALKLYNECILKTPVGPDSSSDLAVAVANRSACLYHLEQYQYCLKDIEYAIMLSYPGDLLYKILERKARSYLALKDHKEALESFKGTLKSLDNAKMAADRRKKMETDVQIMIGLLTKQVAMMEKQSSGYGVRRKTTSFKPLSSSSIEVLETPELGRYVAAREDIEPGGTVLREAAYCAVLLQSCSSTHCSTCFKRTEIPFPCPYCISVIYCSTECQQKATVFHRYECGLSAILNNADFSVTVLMALRMITQHDIQFFRKIKQILQTQQGISSQDKETTEYLHAHQGVRHETKRTHEDFFERTILAFFLSKCLIKVNYFTIQDDVQNDISFIGSLLLHHLQMLQFNCHEVFELETVEGEHIDKSQTKFVGGAYYLKLSLFNHSCDPSIIRYFDGTNVICRAIKQINNGDMIGENYGPIYTETCLEKRREKMLSQYWFECMCKACVEDWPTFDRMNTTIMRFKCNSDNTTVKCRNVVLVPVSTANIMVQCSACSNYTNILKGLKILQDTDSMFRQASKDQTKENYEAALAIFLEILTLLESTLAPPFQSYTVCQQAIRKCMLTFGNKHVIKKT